MSQFNHKFLTGYTGTGKSTLLKQYIKIYRKNKQQVLLYSGTGDTDFAKGCKMVWSADQMEAALNNPENFGSFVILDEGAALYDDVTQKNHPTLRGLFMRGRHLGYTCLLATQYPTSIHPRIRQNCTERFIFAQCSEASAKLLWEDCGRIEYDGKPLWEQILALERFQYFRYLHPAQITKHMTKKM